MFRTITDAHRHTREPMKKISGIVIHISVSPFGDADAIDDWHRARGFNGGGYHEIILNGQRVKGMIIGDDIGKVEFGRPLDDDDWIQQNEVGAHTLGLNDSTIGICLIGMNGYFHTRQIATLLDRCRARLALTLTWIGSVCFYLKGGCGDGRRIETD